MNRTDGSQEQFSLDEASQSSSSGGSENLERKKNHKAGNSPERTMKIESKEIMKSFNQDTEEGKNKESSRSKYFVPTLDSKTSLLKDIHFPDNRTTGDSSSTGNSEKDETLEVSERVKGKLSSPFKAKTTTKKKKGVAFDDSTSSDSDTNNANTNTEEDSQEKYERIMAENKKKTQSSGWIDAKKMKKKMKSNSLFRR